MGAATRGRAEQEDPVDGGFAWIRSKNGQAERQARREISAKTQLAVQSKGYVMGGKTARLQYVQDMLAGTRVVSPTLGDWPSKSANGQGAVSSGGKKKTVISVEKG